MEMRSALRYVRRRDDMRHRLHLASVRLHDGSAPGNLSAWGACEIGEDCTRDAECEIRVDDHGVQIGKGRCAAFCESNADCASGERCVKQSMICNRDPQGQFPDRTLDYFKCEPP